MTLDGRPARLALSGLMLLALCLACGGGGAVSTRDITGAQIQAARGAFDCDADRFYCDAIGRFEGGGVPHEVTQAAAIVGVAKAPGRGFEQIHYALVEPGNQMLIGEVTPDDPGEAAQLQAGVATLRAGGTLPESEPVVAFVRGLATNSAYDAWSTSTEGASLYARIGDQETWLRQNGLELIALQRSRSGWSVGVFHR